MIKKSPGERLRGVMEVRQDDLPMQTANALRFVHEEDRFTRATVLGHAWQLIVRQDSKCTPFGTLTAEYRFSSSVRTMILITF